MGSMLRRGVLPAAAACAAALLAAGLAIAQAPAGYTPGPQNISLPQDWETGFVRYATVDIAGRKLIQNMYVSPGILAAARPGEPLPDGTLIVMAATRARLGADGAPLLDQQGRFIPVPGWVGIAVQEKRAGWGEGYPPDRRNGNWEYALFNPDGSARTGNLDACFTCHLQTRARQDFAFNLWDYVQARK